MICILNIKSIYVSIHTPLHVSDVIFYCKGEIVHVIMLPLTSLSEGWYGAGSHPKHSLSLRMVEISAYPKPLFGAGTLPLLKRFNLSQGSVKKSESMFHTGRFPSYGNVSFLLSFIACVWIYCMYIRTPKGKMKTYIYIIAISLKCCYYMKCTCLKGQEGQDLPISFVEGWFA